MMNMRSGGSPIRVEGYTSLWKSMLHESFVLPGLLARAVMLIFVVSLSGCFSGCDNRASTQPKAGGQGGSNTSGQSSSADSAEAWPVRFTEHADAMDVKHVYRNGEESNHYSVVETVGGGVGILDYDRDGNVDCILTGGGYYNPDKTFSGHPNSLYRSNSKWKWHNVAAKAGADFSSRYSHAVAVADYDNDGFEDVLVTGFVGLQLLHNLGDGTFQEVGESSGLIDRYWSASAGWGDFNHDGCLDLYVTHYLNWSWENNPVCPNGPEGKQDVCAPGMFLGLPDSIYYSDQNGKFVERSDEVGLRKDGKGLGVVVADLNDDQKVDIYVGNDTTENFFYINDGERLKESGWTSGVAIGDRGVPDGSMGVFVGDYNSDGKFDIWVTNYEYENNTLYRNNGNSNFNSVSRVTGIMALGNLFVSWGTALFDADLDGDEDIFVVNGHLARHPQRTPLRQQPLMLENVDSKRYQNRSANSGNYFQETQIARGAAYADLDQDGDLDWVVSRMNEPAAWLENQTANGSHWLEIDLVGTKSPRLPIGSIVEIQYGDRKIVRQLIGGGSFASSCQSTLHAGLGPADKAQVRVRWIDGSTTDLGTLAANQRYTIVEP